MSDDSQGWDAWSRGRGPGSSIARPVGLPCWKELRLKAWLPLAADGGQAQGLSDVTHGQEGSWALLLRRENLSVQSGAPPSLGLAPVPRDGSQVRTLWSASAPWCCQAGGRGPCRVLPPASCLHVEPDGDPSPGDTDGALNLSVPTSVTFGLAAGPGGRFSEPTDSLLVFKPFGAGFLSLVTREGPITGR